MAGLGTPALSSSGGGGGGSSTITSFLGSTTNGPVNVAQVGGSTIALGQAAMASSIPVTIASNQSAVPISGTITANAGSGTFNIQSNASVNVNQWAGTGLGTPTNFGTTPTAVIAGSVNASLFAGTTGLTQTSNALDINIKSSGATVTISGTVTANAGTNLNTSALALDTSVNGLLVAQASTTSGQKGPLVQGAVTTNAPTYTTAQTDPLSLDTSGLLRVSLKDTPANTNNFNVALAASSATVTVTATNLQTNLNQIAGSAISTAASGTQLVGIADGTGNALTSNSTTYTSKKALDVNILGTLGTAFTTAGFVDIKGADGNVFVRQATAANLNAQVVGNVASGSSVSGNPVQVGGQAINALPTAVSNGQVVEASFDKFGRAVVLPFGMRDLVLPMTQLTLTASTSETTLITQVASTFLDLISVVCINTSATATQVDFRDSTGGTVRLSLYLPAGDTRGVVFSTPLPQNAVNTNWTAKSSVSVSSVIITGSYIQNK